MNLIALLILVAAWASLLFLPPNSISRTIQFGVFFSLGILLTLFGGLDYWWDYSMRPGQKSPVVLFCGLGTLLSQGVVFVLGFYENDRVNRSALRKYWNRKGP
jgi:hypothetical protein